MASPTFANGFEEDPMFQKSHYMQDISEQMRVPKRIKATGEFYDDMDHMALGNGGGSNHWSYHDKIDMTVPDRIVVMGQDQHMGTRSAPREITLDNTIISPKDSGDRVRVSTPPRIITLSEHHFPSASEEHDQNGGGGNDNNEMNDNRSVQSSDERHSNNDSGHDGRGMGNGNGVGGRSLAIRPKKLYNPDYVFNLSREATPLPGGDSMSPGEELHLLRKQVFQLNRRNLSVQQEIERLQLHVRYMSWMGGAYFVFRALMWLNRN